MKKSTPDLWRDLLPIKTKESHKYTCGHALIYSAPELTGATCLAARACARMGAGLVTVLAPASVVQIYRTRLPAHIIARDNLDYADPRVSAKLYGCGGLPVQPDLDAKIPVILDAEAILAVSGKKLESNYVLTPHEGEFERAFPHIKGSRSVRAQQAADETGAIIVLKGAETIIAAPQREACLNTHSSPLLATAGSGDVLAGMITGLAAQKMPLFEACCAAVWIHGECARRFGMGLVASDLPDMVPQIFQNWDNRP